MNLGGFSQRPSRKARELRMPPLERSEGEFLDHLKPKSFAQSWNKAYQHRKSSAVSDPAFPTSNY
jgi:hypothetical protein